MGVNRTCGECDLCCTALPVKEIGKLANTRCQHQKADHGCAVYQAAGFPKSCRHWTCLWLEGLDTGDLPRPDDAGYVLDVCAEFIRIRDNDTGAEQAVPVVQIWMDPAHRDPRLRAFLSRRADEGVAALIRYGSDDGFVLFAPQFTGGRGWLEEGGITDTREHTPDDIAAALGPGFEVRDLSKETI